MSKANKGGRPTKGKVDHVGPADLQSLAIDPTWTREMAGIYGAILRPDPSDDSLKLAGVFTACMINTAPAEVLEKLFREIIAMKRASEESPEDKGRNWHALRGYLDFREANGFKPTTSRLKSHLLGDPSKYRNMPDKADGTGWTRIWKAIGFEWLE